ncbi:DUF3493 domain-containing protein [Cyanobacterium aponinum FACHB-4101]|uniref:DUF3493 domain-containing protein n=1 Tax=Cyanobacterium aponinum 0216 TaxID=2676140 RepID=A0A844H072_9CHRO|nr:DUF3493 domain-containing protein [Cyanobacterium aponinum]MBD2395733.1 DUF3493 domain-containing protein [Cyanobacterium aponinum FACHB-4101]MTF39775.1 DUF3493 domain-containing protein [Cyanobacterium aponinum 0216]
MNNNSDNQKNNKLSSEKYAYLKAEAQAPYKGLRKFIYLGLGASGAIGAFIFFAQLLAGKNISDNIYNLFVQITVIAIMVFLYRWEDRKKK